MDIIKVLISLLLGCSPGAWIAFTLLGSSISYPSRLGLAISLSPFVFGALIATLTVIGLDFRAAALATALVCAPAAALFWFARPRAVPSVQFIAPLACFLVLAGGLVALWLSAPEARLYSFHNMLQAEIAYQATLLPDFPEEMELAGERLRYPWFGHIQIGAIGVLADISPFKVFPVLNVLALLAFYLLVLESARRLVGERLMPAACLTAAALMAPNLVGIALSYFFGPVWAGDIRMSTPFHKFIHFDLMASGLALVAAVMLFSLAAIQEQGQRSWIVVTICLIALALVYPVLFPAALVIAGASLVAKPISDWSSGHGLHISRGTIIRALTLVAPIIVLSMYLGLLTSGKAVSELRIARPWFIRQALWQGVMVTTLLLPFVALAVRRAYRTREPERLSLLIASAVLGLAFVFVELPASNEYKYLLSAMIVATPLVVEEALAFLDRGGSALAQMGAGAIAMLFFLVMAPHIVDRHVPWSTAGLGALVDESGFNVAPAEPKRLSWLQAIRERTPGNTVIVHPTITEAVTVLTQRSSYLVASDVGLSRPGYTIADDEWLINVKGYSRELVEHRRAVLIGCVYGEKCDDYASIHAEFAALARPVAVYFPSPSGYQRWLKANGHGNAVWDDGESVVWLLGTEGGRRGLAGRR